MSKKMRKVLVWVMLFLMIGSVIATLVGYALLPR